MICINNDVYNVFNQFLTTYRLYPQPIPQYPNYWVDPFGNLYDTFGNRIIPYHYPNQYDSFMVRDTMGKPHVIGVHQAVAMTFSPDWFDGCIVHHKDENKYNNNIFNLKCETRSNHTRHHAQKYYDKLAQCQMCGKWFVWTANSQCNHFAEMNRNRNACITCSRQCSSKLGRFIQLGFDSQAIINPFGV